MRRIFLLAFLVIFAAPTPARAAEDDLDVENIQLPEDDIVFTVWQTYGPLKRILVASRTGRQQYEYERTPEGIVETLRRSDEEDGLWREIPLARNLYDGGMQRLLREECAFNEDGRPQERTLYRYENGRRMSSQTLRLLPTGAEEILRSQRYRRDANGRILDVLSVEDDREYRDEEHFYEVDDAKRLYIHGVRSFILPGREVRYIFNDQGALVACEETRKDKPVRSLRYDGAGRPLEEISYDIDGEHRTVTTWQYVDGLPRKAVTDFSESSFPELDHNTTYFFYRFGKLKDVVKADANDKAMERVTYEYVHEFDRIGSRWPLPEDAPSWAADRPLQVTETLRGSLERRWSLLWDAGGCDSTLTCRNHKDGALLYAQSQRFDGLGRLQLMQLDDVTMRYEYTLDRLLPGRVLRDGGDADGHSLGWSFNTEQAPALLTYHASSGDEVLRTILLRETDEEVYLSDERPGDAQRVVHVFDKEGLLKQSIVEWNGTPLVTTDYARDGRRLRRAMTRLDGSPVREDEWRYHKNGRVSVVHTRVHESVDWLPAGEYKTRSRYDAQGRLVSEEMKSSAGVVVRTLGCQYGEP